MTKKIITLLIAGFITISVLSGCNSSGTITSTEIEITTEPETKLELMNCITPNLMKIILIS